jgi:hypothetical protein
MSPEQPSIAIYLDEEMKTPDMGNTKHSGKMERMGTTNRHMLLFYPEKFITHSPIYPRVKI